MKKVLLLLMMPCTLLGQTGIHIPEMTHCDAEILSFLNSFDIPGATFALSIDGRMVYSRGFGNATLSSDEPTQPHHLFRIASVSKPITSIGIMKMIDDGLLHLDDKVFGTGGLLEHHWYFSTISITDSRYEDITLQMLLEHTAGWDRNVNCFPNPTSPYPFLFGGCDPLIAPLHVTQTLGVSNPASEEDLIAFLLIKNLNNDPGTKYAYSNMGFLILSEIIEEISGMSYEAWMKQEILHPLGIYDMHIGKNLLSEKFEREGEYLGEGHTTLSLYDTGRFVPFEYGGLSIEIMDGHGGWIATSRDLIRLLLAVDGFATKPDILSPTAITSMSTPSALNRFYAKGWQLNSSGTWRHSGALHGTASTLVRTSSGATWALILNKRLTNADANDFWSQLHNLGWDCFLGTVDFPSHDLLDSPTINASNVQATNVSGLSMDLSWERGNGTHRIVVVKEIMPSSDPAQIQNHPLDGIDYNPNSQFTLGDNIGENSFVVYNGDGDSVTVTNLSANTAYAIRVYEYNKRASSGNNALYLLGNAAELVQSTTTLNTDEDEFSFNLRVFPTIVNDKLTVENKNILIEPYKFKIYNLYGGLIKKGSLVSSKAQLNLENLNPGVYFLKLYTSSRQEKVFKIIKK